MSTLYAGVIASPDRAALERVNVRYFQSKLQFFDRSAPQEEPRYPRIYAIYYERRECAPAYMNGPDIIKDLEGVPWKWEYLDKDAYSPRCIEKERNDLWDALNLKAFSYEPVLDTDIQIATSLGCNY